MKENVEIWRLFERRASRVGKSPEFLHSFRGRPMSSPDRLHKEGGCVFTEYYLEIDKFFAKDFGTYFNVEEDVYIFMLLFPLGFKS